MKVGIACDHHGIEIKNYIIEQLKEKYYIIDYGTDNNDSVDYPEFAFKIGEEIRDNNIDFGILLCNTGIGMSIACNKVKNVRCAHVGNIYEAEMSRLHNNANVIALSTRLDKGELIKMVDKFLSTEYILIDRHQKRIEMIDNYD